MDIDKVSTNQSFLDSSKGNEQQGDVCCSDQQPITGAEGTLFARAVQESNALDIFYRLGIR